MGLPFLWQNIKFYHYYYYQGNMTKGHKNALDASTSHGAPNRITWSIASAVLAIFLLCLKVKPKPPDPRQGVEYFLWQRLASPAPATVTGNKSAT
jgi:hypothetical protein